MACQIRPGTRASNADIPGTGNGQSVETNDSVTDFQLRFLQIPTVKYVLFSEFGSSFEVGLADDFEGKHRLCRRCAVETGRIASSGSPTCPATEKLWVADQSRAIGGLVGTGTERTSVMVGLRNAMMAVVLSTGIMGCSFSHFSLFHCDECDDFPTPAYGPGYSMVPGTYTGPPARDSLEATRPSISATSSASNPSTDVQDAASETDDLSHATPAPDGYSR